MKYIKTAIIENFQSHKKTVVEFDSRMNVIVGPSDQGKSAIIRAIKWALFNEPRGTEYIRHGESMARVEIEMSDGNKVTRERSPSKNRYILTREDGTQVVFEGFGNDVPEEIKEAHSIKKVSIDNDSGVCLNIGEQLEAPFLVSQTGSTKAKAIGRLTGVHIIDNAIKDCLADLKRENQAQSKYKKELENLEESLKEYKDLGDIEKRLKKAEKQIASLEEKALLCGKIEALNDSKEQILKEIIQNNEQIVKTANVNKAEERYKKLIELYERNEKMVVLQIKKNQVHEDINSQNKVIQQFKDIERVNEIIGKIGALDVNYKIMQKLSDSYNSIVASIKEGQKYVEGINSEIKKALHEYEITLKKFSKCPVCFGEIDEKTIERVINQLTIDNE